MQKKIARNNRIREYHAKHPNTSIRAIGRMFKLSHVRILKILAATCPDLNEANQAAGPTPTPPQPAQFHIGANQ